MKFALTLAVVALLAAPADAREAKQLRIVKQPGLGYLNPL